MATVKILDLKPSSEDKEIKALYDAGFTEDQIMAMVEVIGKIINTVRDRMRRF